jgi:DNA replication protein DnaC
VAIGKHLKKQLSAFFRKRNIASSSMIRGLHEEYLLNFGATPDLVARFIKELASCGFIKEKRNVIFLGKSGTGKTHLATALSIEACSQGYRTRFVTGCALANELIEARNEKVLSRVIVPLFAA